MTSLIRFQPKLDSLEVQRERLLEALGPINSGVRHQATPTDATTETAPAFDQSIFRPDRTFPDLSWSGEQRLYDEREIDPAPTASIDDSEYLV